MKGPARSVRIAVVTVHGTGDERETPDNSKWWEAASEFSRSLGAKLRARRIEADIYPFIWSGTNSALAREQAAYSLSRQIKRCAKRHDSIHIVAHSHGGNVANDAARILRGPGGRRTYQIASLTTVGTPFFKSELSTANAVGWWALLLIFAAGLLGFIALVIADQLELAANSGVAGFLAEQSEQVRRWPVDARLLAALNMIALFLVVPSVIRGAQRARRVRARRHGSGAFLAVWHPNDEAMGFLQKVEALHLELLPPGALWIGSRTPALVIGARFVFATLLGGAILLALGSSPLAALFYSQSAAGESLSRTALAFMFYAILGAPIMFSLVYVLVRTMLGALPEHFSRSQLNLWLTNLLRGMAYGRDGEERLGGIRAKPFDRDVEELVLSGELAERMRVSAGLASSRLIEKYRWALFTVGTENTAAIAELANDAMTWSSLIHTTYFEQTELVAPIAEFIAGNA